ncbi:cullin-associated NEDD8-dissociated protein 1-like [Zingiber officinale]|nr:cullin-associated NEDD8-dissociated protein 1-like [Zingiber officinale]XP_042384042.1 cullin-associated NEDD8-dissociated protein 1-like [Zingiber officinale]
MASHSPSVFHPYIKALSSPVLSAVGERYYKVTAEALRVCGELVRVLRPNFETSMPDFRPYVSPIYSAILARLANQDQDQEVKECAISCMSLVISTFGDNLQKDLPACLPILVDRMGNEITRLTAVKAFAVIANSPLRINLSCVLEQVVSELTGFLRKANRALRQATLGTLNSLVVAYGEQISSTTYEVIIVELSTLISEADLHMTALALELCCTMMMAKISSQSVGVTVSHKVLPQALILIRSSLLQGQALQALQRFFASLVHSANTSFDSLLDSLLSSAKPSPQSGGLAKQALHSVAQCVAVLCLAAGDQKCASTVDMLKGILKDDSNMNSAKQHLALLCLGEIGRRKDLSVHVHIENIVIESFQSPFEEIKSAASYALGNIAVGNLSKYLPFILDQIDNQQKKQYLLLHSLKEVIARQSIDQPGKSELQESNVEKILSLLFNHCESDEEGVRNVVAECLGKIALIEPKKLVPALKERTASSTAFTRATVVIAIKYAIVERPEKIDEILYPEISTFLMLIKDSDRHVRRAAVLALSTAAHNKPNLIKGLLPELLPLLYDQTVIKKEMIRTVDLGPFKHIVDDGLELRKAAFECVDTLLDSCLDQMNPSTFIVPYLISGLSDHYDVKMPCHLILSKLADKCPAAVLAVLDSLVDPLEKTISHKPKADAVKQEVDRNEDMIRSAFRAIASISRISGGEYSLKFKMLINNILNTAALAEKYNFVRCE